MTAVGVRRGGMSKGVTGGDINYIEVVLIKEVRDRENWRGMRAWTKKLEKIVKER